MYARRTILKGAASLPLAAILADPMLARAAAHGLQDVAITTAGGKAVSGALALPAKTPAAAVLLIHEWWGLNDQIKSVAAKLAEEGYVALAVDLYDGKVATDPDDARSYMGQVDGGEATDTLVSWIGWLKDHDRTNGRVATVGWCFGGGWSLNASIAAPVDGTIIYYGNVSRKAADLKALQGPVLGHFATEDQWINQAMVSGFEAEMKQAGKQLTTHWYDANHAFANPTSARYDEADAALSWQRTQAFLAETLG